MTRDDQLVVATSESRWLLTLPETPTGDDELVIDLAAIAAGEPPTGGALRRLGRNEIAPVALALSLVTEELATARHQHRRGWTDGGGPWLGIGWTDDQLVVSTSHMVVDGYGHACLADRIAAAGAPVSLAVERQRRAGLERVGDRPLAAGRPVIGAAPLGVATCELPGRLGFAEFVYTTLLATEAMFGAADPRRSRSASVQIPIAPGDRDDPDRRLRRVVPGLVALAMRGDELESLDELRARLPDVIARETALRGPLTRLLRGSRDLPVGVALKRRLVGGSRRPRSWMPPAELLAGRGCASLLRMTPSDRPAAPLYAVSAPALDPGPGDDRGGSVITAVEHAGGFAIAVSGTGRAGDAAGASEYLELWRGQLQTARAFSDSRPRRISGAHK